MIRQIYLRWTKNQQTDISIFAFLLTFLFCCNKFFKNGLLVLQQLGLFMYQKKYNKESRPLHYSFLKYKKTNFFVISQNILKSDFSCGKKTNH